MTVVLYQWAAHAGLPSLTAASLQAEAYLRFARVDFRVETCQSASASPTGVLPALEQGADIVASPPGGDLAASRAIISHLRKGGPDLDAALAPAQRAEALAFTCLTQARLDTATQYTTWCEGRGFQEFRQAAYGGLPFPLNWVVARNQQREVTKQLGRIDGTKAFAEATEALAALADRLRTSPGPFFFGSTPSSLDALLFGHLAFYRHSPIAAPILRQTVEAQRVLCSYVDSIMADWFSTPAPAAAPQDDPGSWSDAAQGQGQQPRRPPSVEELRMWQGSKYWLGGAAGAIATYVLLGGGGYLQLLPADQLEEEYDDDDDEGDDEGGE